MTVGIYAIYSATDGACLYVGQSKNIETRFRQHVTKLKNRRTKALPRFVEWYHAHGAQESLLHLVIAEECEDNDLIKNELEGFWFDELKPRFYGKTPSMLETWNHSHSTRISISESLRAKAGTSHLQRSSSGKLLKPFTCRRCGAHYLSVSELMRCQECRVAEKRQRSNAITKRRRAPNPTHAKPSKEELQDWITRGLNMYEMAAIAGFSAMTIRNLLVHYALREPIRRKQFVEALATVTKESLEEAYLVRRLNLEQLGEELQVSAGVVRRLLDHYSIPRRAWTVKATSV